MSPGAANALFTFCAFGALVCEFQPEWFEPNVLRGSVS